MSAIWDTLIYITNEIQIQQGKNFKYISIQIFIIDNNNIQYNYTNHTNNYLTNITICKNEKGI